MAQIVKSNCPSCGAPLTLPPGVDKVNCSACGSSLLIEFGDGYYTLKSAEQIANAIQHSSGATRDAIIENTFVTKSELQRLQLSQEISSTQMQLTNIESEIRLLFRGPKSKVSTSQISALSSSQYQALDRIRVLQKQLNAPQPDDLQGLQNLLEWENGWCQKEISALSASDCTDRSQLIQSLNAQIAWNNKRISSIKTEFLKMQCRSLQVEDPSHDDSSKINSLLILLNEDEQKLRQYRYSPEGSDLYNQIKNRQASIWNLFQSNERSRFSKLTSVTNSSAVNNDRIAIREQLEQVEQDLLTIRNSPETVAKREFEQKLMLRKSALHRLLMDQERSEKKANRRNKSKIFFAGIVAFFACLVSGTVLLIHRIATDKSRHTTGEISAPISMGLSSKGSSKDSSRVESNSRDISEEKATTVLEPSSKKITYESAGESTFKSLGMGFLLGFLSFIGIVIGLVVLAVFLFRVESGSSVKTGILLILVSFDVAFSGYIFLRRAFMPIKINTLNKFSSLSIRKKNQQYGSDKQGLAKTAIFIITIISAYLFFLGILMIFNSTSSAFTVIFFLLGIIFGPVIAWQVTRRSAIISADPVA